MSTDNTIGLILSYDPDSEKLDEFLASIPANFYKPSEANGKMLLNLDMLHEDIRELGELLYRIGMIPDELSLLQPKIQIKCYMLSNILYTEHPLVKEYDLIFRLLSRAIPKENRLRKVMALTTCNGWTLGELFIGLHDDIKDSILIMDKGNGR